MITLSDPVLGDLDLRADPFAVVSFQIGPRAPRVNTRNRALADGALDDTRYGGARAVSVGITLNEHPACVVNPTTMQGLLDRLLPYTLPRRRPVLKYSLPGSEGDIRQLTVRGNGAPVQISGPKHQGIVAQFVSGDGDITSAGEPTCLLITPAGDVEAGRTYPVSVGDAAGRIYDRTYPASLAIGDRLVTQLGNDRAHWTAAIFGAVTNPYVTINGTQINFNVNGGVDLLAGQSLVLDSKARTIYLNNDPTASRYNKSNFMAWSWDDVLLEPGDNLVRFGGSVLGAGASVNLCWSPTWAG